MYLEDVCSIKRTDDGKFVVSVSPPKPKSTKPSKSNEAAIASPSMDPKTYVASNVDELLKLIKEEVGGGKDNEKKSSDDKFKKGFKGTAGA